MDFSCIAYADDGPPRYALSRLPDRWWRKIELTYPDGRQLVLVYDQEPAGGEMSELPDLMWQLQNQSALLGFTVTVIDADGTRTDAPPIGQTRKDAP